MLWAAFAALYTDQPMDEKSVVEVIATEPEVKPEKPSKKKNIVAIVVALLLVLITALLLWQNFGPSKSDARLLEDSIKAQIGQLEDKSNDEIKAALDEIIEEGALRICINMNPIFVDGASSGTLKIENHPNNHYNQRVIITLDETGEQVYHSGLMPVNSNIYEDTLDVDLDAGEYEATAVFTAHDVETDAEVGQTIAKICISVLT